MAALTQPYETFERPGIVVSYKLSNVKIFKGELVGINASGYIVSMNHATASLKFVGVANETVDNSTGNAGDKSINVTKTASVIYKANGFTPTVANLGSEVYAFSNWELQVSTVGLTNLYKVGTIVAIENTSTGAAGMRIRIDNYTL